MIAYRVELWCDGCGVHFAKGLPSNYIADIRRFAQTIEGAATGAHQGGWVKQGADHFCPQCQIQRGLKGPHRERIAAGVVGEPN
jgi:hypothetical protein